MTTAVVMNVAMNVEVTGAGLVTTIMEEEVEAGKFFHPQHKTQTISTHFFLPSQNLCFSLYCGTFGAVNNSYQGGHSHSLPPCLIFIGKALRSLPLESSNIRYSRKQETLTEWEGS
jgi:hypothetical protein